MSEPPVERLWQAVEAPSAEELREVARQATTEPQRAEMPPAGRRRLRSRWAIGVAVLALLVGSGLGLGLGTWLTPSGDASRNVAGLGFLPERGWTVVQRGGPNPAATTAIASKGGIVVSVTSSPRGDPAEDVSYPVRELPLRVADARPSQAEPNRLELRGAVGGYNIDARVTFSETPSASARAAAQRQLDRLVVAAQRVTIAVRPAISSPATLQVTAFGTIDSGKAGESVTIQAKDCGATFFRVFAGANTEAGGTWSTFIFPRITTTLRAVWNGETSNEVVFRQRAFLGLRQLSATRFSVGPGYGTRFAGKLITIQRFDQRLGRWAKIRVVRVTGDGFGMKFTLRVPRGTRIRAVFPNSQAGPCYLGGTSPVIRT